MNCNISQALPVMTGALMAAIGLYENSSPARRQAPTIRIVPAAEPNHRAMALKTALMPQPQWNVQAVGIGQKISDSKPTGQTAIKIFVQKTSPNRDFRAPALVRSLFLARSGAIGMFSHRLIPPRRSWGRVALLRPATAPGTFQASQTRRRFG
jgi:hypothetical protein